MIDLKAIGERMLADERREEQGPITLYRMLTLYEEYERCVKLAEHNRSGRNPRYSHAVGKLVGDRLQVKADKLAASYPAFPEAYANRNKR